MSYLRSSKLYEFDKTKTTIYCHFGIALDCAKKSNFLWKWCILEGFGVKGEKMVRWCLILRNMIIYRSILNYIIWSEFFRKKKKLNCQGRGLKGKNIHLEFYNSKNVKYALDYKIQTRVKSVKQRMREKDRGEKNCHTITSTLKF